MSKTVQERLVAHGWVHVQTTEVNHLRQITWQHPQYGAMRQQHALELVQYKNGNALHACCDKCRGRKQPLREYRLTGERRIICCWCGLPAKITSVFVYGPYAKTPPCQGVTGPHGMNGHKPAPAPEPIKEREYFSLDSERLALWVAYRFSKLSLSERTDNRVVFMSVLNSLAELDLAVPDPSMLPPVPAAATPQGWIWPDGRRESA
jgi:hypothetical protein